jgi:hypothetical protein
MWDAFNIEIHFSRGRGVWCFFRLYIRSISGVEYYIKLKWTYGEGKNLTGVHVPENGGSNPPHGTKKSQKKFEKSFLFPIILFIFIK